MATVESPCIRNCCLDDNDICVGCYRSLTEITCWSQVDDEAKLSILAAVKARLRDKPNVIIRSER
ncbi:DUF1289 domain-containing protein [Cellvibrio sp. OA-2007]|uniref:DUF1289 domain-containing protein n=1 Tax=Cellvibrio sp. OA-2007 TaxID=529823 RepID=UPI000A076E3F|nr:DUF1289 domain-containing protein [Cellvibrio sp. OA-2007]